jgi:hypothetical protein
VPLDDIREALEAYFHLGFNDKQLEEYLSEHYNTEVYGLGYVFSLFYKPHPKLTQYLAV